MNIDCHTRIPTWWSDSPLMRTDPLPRVRIQNASDNVSLYVFWCWLVRFWVDRSCYYPVVISWQLSMLESSLLLSTFQWAFSHIWVSTMSSFPVLPLGCPSQQDLYFWISILSSAIVFLISWTCFFLLWIRWTHSPFLASRLVVRRHLRLWMPVFWTFGDSHFLHLHHLQNRPLPLPHMEPRQAGCGVSLPWCWRRNILFQGKWGELLHGTEASFRNDLQDQRCCLANLVERERVRHFDDVQTVSYDVQSVLMFSLLNYQITLLKARNCRSDSQIDDRCPLQVTLQLQAMISVCLIITGL